MPKVDVPPSAWEVLGTPSPETLTEARLQLHWGAQLVAAVPLAFRKTESDFSHANLGWISAESMFISREVGAESQVHFGLRVQDFSVVALAGDLSTLDTLALEGKTLDQAYDWISQALDRFGVGKVEPGALPKPGEGFPEHAVRFGAPFTGGDAPSRTELARWFSNALFVLSEPAESELGASAVRTWPHHFDMATLITIEGAEEPENARSIGVGLSPGDSDYNEPYFYTTPWPYPEHVTLSPLAGRGLWHMTGWTGAVLKGSRLIDGADGALQLDRARKFLASAIPAGRRLAGA